MKVLRRSYDVQNGTGWSTSLSGPSSNWYRGGLYRAAMPAVMLAPPQVMRDPSNPATWRHNGR